MPAPSPTGACDSCLRKTLPRYAYSECLSIGRRQNTGQRRRPVRLEAAAARRPAGTGACPARQPHAGRDLPHRGHGPEVTPDSIVLADSAAPYYSLQVSADRRQWIAVFADAADLTLKLVRGPLNAGRGRRQLHDHHRPHRRAAGDQPLFRPPRVLRARRRRAPVLQRSGTGRRTGHQVGVPGQRRATNRGPWTCCPRRYCRLPRWQRPKSRPRNRGSPCMESWTRRLGDPDGAVRRRLRRAPRRSDRAVGDGRGLRGGWSSAAWRSRRRTALPVPW